MSVNYKPSLRTESIADTPGEAWFVAQCACGADGQPLFEAEDVDHPRRCDTREIADREFDACLFESGIDNFARKHAILEDFAYIVALLHKNPDNGQPEQDLELLRQEVRNIEVHNAGGQGGQGGADDEDAGEVTVSF